MAASGFRRKSRANSRARRSQWKAARPRPARCPEPGCGEFKPQHAACPACGRYRGRQVTRPARG